VLLGALDAVFAASARALNPDVILAFTREEAEEEVREWHLDPTTRYSHTFSYIEAVLQETGFWV